MIFFSKLSLKSYFDEITLKKLETLSKLRKDTYYFSFTKIYLTDERLEASQNKQ